MSHHNDRESVTRRSFLSTLARGTAGTALCTMTPLARARGGQPAGRPDPGPLRLSTSTIHFLHLPVEKACKRIAKLGFEAVDIWSAYQKCPHLDDALTRLGGTGLKQVLSAEKLKLFAFSVYVGGFPKYAKLLGEAGGGVAVRGSTGPCDPKELKSKMRQFLESLKPEVELAAKHGSRLAIENHGNALLDSIDSLKAFTDLNDSPHVGIALAPYHLQAGKMSVEEAIRICGRQLLFFYAWQNGKGTKQLPGHGPTDFAPWIQALAGAGYEGCLNVFMHGDLEPDVMAEALAKSRDYLKECHTKTKGLHRQSR